MLTAQQYQDRAQKFIKDHQMVNDFVATWEPHIKGVGVIDTFVIQLVNVIYDLLQPPLGLMVDQSPKPASSIESKKAEKTLEAGAIELLEAMTERLEEDVLMALRFLYYVKAYSAIPDHLYDQAEKRFIARPEIEDTPIMNPGSDFEEDYPERCRALAFYLMIVTADRRKAAAP